MARITLHIDVNAAGDELSWETVTTSGRVANPVALWSGDLQHALNEAGYTGGPELGR